MAVDDLSALAQRIDRLERRLAPGGVILNAIGDCVGKLFSQWRREHEAKGYMVYRGVFDSDSAYTRGDTVTHGGSLWFCTSPTKGQPGREVDWRLVAKSGDRGVVA